MRMVAKLENAASTPPPHVVVFGVDGLDDKRLCQALVVDEHIVVLLNQALLLGAVENQVRRHWNVVLLQNSVQRHPQSW